jgi:hypothetical protein
MNKYMQEVHDASLAVQNAEVRLETALHKWRANTEYNEALEQLYREVPIGDVARRREAATAEDVEVFEKVDAPPSDGAAPPIYPPIAVSGLEKKQHPLGDLSKTLVRELIALRLDPETVLDLNVAAKSLPKPWNTRVSVGTTLRTLHKRGLVVRKNGEDGKWVVPNNKALQASLGW